MRTPLSLHILTSLAYLIMSRSCWAPKWPGETSGHSLLPELNSLHSTQWMECMYCNYLNNLKVTWTWKIKALGFLIMSWGSFNNYLEAKFREILKNQAMNALATPFATVPFVDCLKIQIKRLNRKHSVFWLRNGGWVLKFFPSKQVLWNKQQMLRPRMVHSSIFTLIK